MLCLCLADHYLAASKVRLKFNVIFNSQQPLNFSFKLCNQSHQIESCMMALHVCRIKSQQPVFTFDIPTTLH